MQERKKPTRPGVPPRSDKANAPTSKARNSDKTRKRSTPPAPTAKRGAHAPATPACPECGKMFRTDEAVQTHRHAAHGTAATIVGDQTRCPECGSLVKNSNMATHRLHKHGV